MVTILERDKFNSRIVTFSLWTAVFWYAISTISNVTDILQGFGRHSLVCGNYVYYEKVKMTFG